ncbi:Hypothetical protein CAP_3997 [Chondromyces apiculatus DSM 436]|uniref:Uncharacterized protein n=1 Tax=Chondromyces apiculatus DSM 436 TaxID=1192034 RepID=A0A017TGQ5_9BACT|nr:Hypothetical protein CAP_3997 [Chondromyces apiculatus DSM 436]
MVHQRLRFSPTSNDNRRPTTDDDDHTAANDGGRRRTNARRGWTPHLDCTRRTAGAGLQGLNLKRRG